MPRKQGKAVVPEGNDPVPHDEFGSDEPTIMADLYRMLEESFDIESRVNSTDKIKKMANV